MTRPLMNAMLATGYALGTLFVWIGIEMFAIDGAGLAPALFSVAVGIFVWGMLSILGRAMRQRELAGQSLRDPASRQGWPRP